jgi:hypothetical protein
MIISQKNEIARLLQCAACIEKKDSSIQYKNPKQLSVYSTVWGSSKRYAF